jgi:hypothetical protein
MEKGREIFTSKEFKKEWGTDKCFIQLRGPTIQGAGPTEGWRESAMLPS